MDLKEEVIKRWSPDVGENEHIDIKGHKKAKEHSNRLNTKKRIKMKDLDGYYDIHELPKVIENDILKQYNEIMDFDIQKYFGDGCDEKNNIYKIMVLYATQLGLNIKEWDDDDEIYDVVPYTKDIKLSFFICGKKYVYGIMCRYEIALPQKISLRGKFFKSLKDNNIIDVENNPDFKDFDIIFRNKGTKDLYLQTNLLSEFIVDVDSKGRMSSVEENVLAEKIKNLLKKEFQDKVKQEIKNRLQRFIKIPLMSKEDILARIDLLKQKFNADWRSDWWYGYGSGGRKEGDVTHRAIK